MDIERLDRIHIRDLMLRCIVGVYDFERTTKQDVNIQVTLFADLRQACESDNLQDTVDYKALKKQIVEMVEVSNYLLIEKLAGRIAEICLATPRVERAVVRVEKPGALRFARTVAVEITRDREGR